MKYCLVDGNCRRQQVDAVGLYRRAIKGKWAKVHGMPYRAVTLNVELDIADEQEKKEKVPNKKAAENLAGKSTRTRYGSPWTSQSPYLTLIEYPKLLLPR